MSIEIRTMAEGDDAVVARILASSFGPEGPTIAALVTSLRQHTCGRDGLAWIAEVDGVEAGFTMVTRNRLDTAPRTVDVGVLSPLAVAPEHQRRGVGRALVEHAIARAAEAGLPVLFLEGDPAYYVRLGFVTAGPLGFRRPSLRIPEAAFQAVLLPQHEPWMTGTLVYAEPFWDHDCVGLRETGASG